MEGEKMIPSQEGVSDETIDQTAASFKARFDQWANTSKEGEYNVDYTVLNDLCELSLGIDNTAASSYKGWTPADFKKLLEKIASFNEAYAHAIGEILEKASQKQESVPQSPQEAALYLVQYNNINGVVEYLKRNREKIGEFCEQVIALSYDSGEADTNLIKDAFEKIMKQLI